MAHPSFNYEPAWSDSIAGSLDTKHHDEEDNDHLRSAFLLDTFSRFASTVQDEPRLLFLAYCLLGMLLSLKFSTQTLKMVDKANVLSVHTLDNEVLAFFTRMFATRSRKESSPRIECSD